VEIIPFIKNLFIDSLAGISLRNLPFIILQLASSGLAILIYLKISRQNENIPKITALGIAFTALFIIAFTSVPLSIVAGFLVLGSLANLPAGKAGAQSRKGGFITSEQIIVVLLLSYAGGSGHLVLLALSLVVIYLFYRFIK